MLQTKFKNQYIEQKISRSWHCLMNDLVLMLNTILEGLKWLYLLIISQNEYLECQDKFTFLPTSTTKGSWADKSWEEMLYRNDMGALSWLCVFSDRKGTLPRESTSSQWMNDITEVLLLSGTRIILLVLYPSIFIHWCPASQARSKQCRVCVDTRVSNCFHHTKGEADTSLNPGPPRVWLRCTSICVTDRC